MAHAVRAVLLAMATVTSGVGLHSRSDRTQAPVPVSVLGARRVTEVPPVRMTAIAPVCVLASRPSTRAIPG